MNGLTSGQLAKFTGVTTETLRYYERRGLIPEPHRRASGYRIYQGDAIVRLRFIKGAQELGFSLEEIQELLALRVDQEASSSQVRQRAQAKVAQIEAKIRTLQQMRDALAHLIDLCDGEGPTSACPILEAIDMHAFAS